MEIKYLLQTHAHIDHISGLAKIKDLIQTGQPAIRLIRSQKYPEILVAQYSQLSPAR
ncbi:MAG: MBL fold metallo-hydrolase [Pseudomonadales bacterium]